MTADIGESLRALVRDHLEGRLSLEAYRRRRAQLLDGLPACGRASLDTTRPREVTEFEITTQPRTVLARINADPPEPEPRVRDKEGRGRIAALAALALALAIAVALLVRSEIEARAPQHAPAAASGAASSRKSADPIRALLQPLRQDSHWSDARVLAINAALIRMGPARIAAARNSDWFNGVVDRVRNRLRQQQALAAAPLTPRTSPLAALAKTLGIPLASPEAHAPARRISD